MKYKIFIVDDHPLVREWLTNLINQQPDLHVCGTADDAPEALEAIGMGNPHVAIVDLGLKTTAGLDLIKDLNNLYSEVAVLVLSMHEESHYAERALRAGARGYITKRESTKNVIAGIRAMIEGRLFLSQRFAESIAERAVLKRSENAETPIFGLSDRELQVFELVGKGHGTKQIAEDLHVSMKTVQAYQARIKQKLGLKNVNELLRKAVLWEDSQLKPSPPNFRST